MTTFESLNKRGNTITYIDKLGDITLKYVSLGDIEYLSDLGETKISGREYVEQALYHQLIKPTVSLKDFSELEDSDLVSICEAFRAKNSDLFKSYVDTGNYFDDIRSAINAYIDTSLRKMAEMFKPLLSPANELMQAISDMGQRAAKALEAFRVNLPDFSELFKGIDKAGLPSNWGENRSHQERELMETLLQQGIPIIWVPRRAVIDKLLAAETLRARKQVIVREEKSVLEDCRLVLQNIERQELKNARQLTLEAIEIIESAKAYRSAQCSAATVCDALFGYMLGRKVSHDQQMKIHKPVRTRSQNLTASYLNVPIDYLSAALAVQPVAVALKQFDRSKRSAIPDGFNRHATAHSLSDRQHKKSNSIIAIMLATSLLKTCDDCGQGWLYELTHI